MNETLFAGLDVGTEHHWLTVIAPDGRKLLDEKVVHGPGGLSDMAEQLMGLCGGQPELMRIAVESPHGPVVDLLLERQFKTFFINPKKVDRFRDRHSVAGAKDDRLDGYVLGRSLKTDEDCFHEVNMKDPDVIKLRELLRSREDLDTDLRRVTNRIRDQFYRYHWAMTQVCPAADEPWVWKLWELHKRPSEKAPTIGKVRSLLKQHRIRRVTAEQVHELLKAPSFTVAPGVESSAVDSLELLVPQASLLNEQLSRVNKRITGVLDDIENRKPDGGPADPPAKTSTLPSDVRNLRTMFGAGDYFVGSLIAFGAQHVAERNYPGLRAHTGIAPITERSGKYLHVKMRRACSGELRRAMHFLADNQRRKDPKSAALYAAHMQRGHSRARALRAVADRCLRIIMAMLRDNMPYDPGRAEAAIPGAA